MRVDKIREEFELWLDELTKDWPEPCDAIRKVAEVAYWDCWQASRAAVVVELPFLFPFYRQEVTEALSSVGLKVKP